MPRDPQVLLVSKPLVPPWDDSAKNIARDQAAHGARYRYRVMATPGAAPPAPGVDVAPVYPDRGGWGPAMPRNLRAMVHGLRPRGSAIYHYFFAPNALASIGGRAQRLAARVPTVQTFCSIPASFDRVQSLVFTDRVVVLSEHTRRRLVDAGVDEAKVRLVRPGIPNAYAPLSPPERAAARDAHGLGPGPLLLFPGDWEVSSAADTVARAVPLVARRRPDATVVFACREKRPGSLAIRDRIRADLERAGVGARARFVGSVEDMRSLVGCADAAMLPADSLYAKMDAPLVLLEAMAMGVPLVLADTPPLDEILAMGGGIGIPPGDPEALAEAALRVVEDASLARRLGEAGAAAAKESFSAAAMAGAVESIYDEMLGRAARGER